MSSITAPQPVSLVFLLRQVLDAVGVSSRFSEADLDAGMQQLQIEAAGLALELMGAAARGVPLHRAVHDDRNCRRAHIVHSAFEDFLTRALEPELKTLVTRAMRPEVVTSLDAIFGGLAALATNPAAPAAERVLARFALYELLRVGLLVMEYESDETTSIFASGLDTRDIDARADAELDVWIRRAEAGEIKSVDLPSMLACAAVFLQVEGAANFQGMQVSLDDVERFVDRARTEVALRERFDRGEQLLLRLKHGLDDLVDMQTLIDRHPAVFGDATPGRLYTQLSRLDPSRTRRRKPTVLDIARKAAKGAK